MNPGIDRNVRALVIDGESAAANEPSLAGMLSESTVQVSSMSWNNVASAASTAADVIIARVDAAGRAAALDIVRLRPDLPVVVVTTDAATDGADLIREGVEDVVRLDERAPDLLLSVLARAIARRSRAPLVRSAKPSPTEPLALCEGDAGFRALAEAMPAAVFIVRDNHIAYVNPVMCMLTEYAPEEILGRNLVALLGTPEPADAPGLREPGGHGDLLNGRFEMQIRTRSDEDRWIDLTTAATRYEGGAATIGIGIDISERKRLESRTRQRLQFEALGRLAGGVAHDFNNLLLVISGGIQLISEKLEAGDPLREFADAIAKAAERASLLTRDLLAFGRRQMLIARPVDVSEIVAGLEGLLRDGAGDAIAFTTNLATDLPPVLVDRARLEQAIVNLAVNARDAMPTGGSLVISTDLVEVDAAMQEGRPWLTDGIWVRLMVADTGPGIAPDVLPHVFEPFFSTRSNAPSSGLGLSTALGIVKQSGGFIWIDSEPGEGTRVTILLRPVEHGTPAAPRAVLTAPTKPRVLLVEDEEEVRSLLTIVLEGAGFALHCAADAESALELAGEIDIDVLLTDVVLPGLTGPELAARIRASKPSVQVLYMSGYTGHSALSDLGDEGEFIQKPFAARALVERLRSLIR